MWSNSCMQIRTFFDGWLLRRQLLAPNALRCWHNVCSASLKMKSLVWAFLVAINASAATYYIDYVGGSDASNGTSTNAPWKRHPYMNGFAGSYSHTAGDRFIFKGGVTWSNSCFRLDITAGGSPTAYDYYGVDETWYSGSAWSRPVFTAGSQRITGGGNQLIYMYHGTSVNNIIIDNLELTGFYWDSSDGSYGFAAIYIGQESNIVVQNCYFHGWSYGTGAQDYFYQVLGQGSAPYNAGCVVSNCVFDGASSPNSGFAVYQVPVVRNCVARNMSNAFVVGGVNPEVSGCTIGPINASFSGVHENCVETIGSGVFKMFNNVIHDPTSVAFLTSSDMNAYYIYNNVFYNCNLIPIQFDFWSLAGYNAYVYNNTVATSSGYEMMRIVDRGIGPLNILMCQNNHYISSGTGLIMLGPGATYLTNNYNAIMTPTVAASQGYTTGNLYAPTASGNPTVDSGTSAPSGIFSSDRVGALRPQGAAWDIGAYEYASSSRNPPSIMSQPSGWTNAAGTQFSLSVAASGASTLSYQWRWNTNAISGATGYSYTKASAQTNDSAWYDCVISNPYGSVTSAVAYVLITNATFGGAGGTWYVDSAASGANNGTSWANAWTSPAAIVWANVKPGDTIYLSGGTYTSPWKVGASGSAGSPITIAASAEPGHNGLVIFDFAATGTNSSTTAITCQQNYITLAGGVTGACHIVVRNLINTISRTTATAFNCAGANNVIFDHVALTNVNNGFDFQSSSGAGVQVRYCILAQLRGDRGIAIVDGTEAWDTALIYSNNIECLYNTTAPPGYSGYVGPDPIWAGSGVSIFGNVIRINPTSLYTSSQHPDVVQCTGNYVKFFDNEIVNIGDSGFDYDCYANANPHDVWIYNNVYHIVTNLDTYPEFFRLYTSGQAVQSIKNFKLFNNTFADSDGDYWVIRFDMFNGNPSASGIEIKNNIFMNCGTASSYDRIINIDNSSAFTNGSFSLDYNLYWASNSPRYINFRGTVYSITDWIAANEPHSRTSQPSVASYTYHGANNDFHLAAGDTAAKDLGLSLSSYFSADKDGLARPQGSAWDIGAYELASGTGVSTNQPPVVSAISQSAPDVDAYTPGLQIYAGTTVQYSSSASDPNGDPLSWQWLYTVNGGADTVYQSGTGAVAMVSYTYPAGSAGSSYTWKLRVSDGHLSSESDLTVGVEAVPVAGARTFDATSGTITAPFVAANGYIYQSVQTDVTNGGRASYSFTLTNSASCVVQVTVNAPSDAENSIYLNIDAEPQDPDMIWDIPVTSGFQQLLAGWRGSGTFDTNQFVPKVFNLAQGTHQLIVVGREPNTQLSQLAILRFPPLNPRVVPSK